MSIYDFEIKDKKGNAVSMSEFKGKVLLIVNTATHCGFTSQYDGLEDLYEKYSSLGFEILDFPCNQFAGQAPEDDGEITAFCSMRYGIKYRQFAKIDVNGKNESPLYTYLKSQKGGVMGRKIKWNFTKFLVDKDGNVVDRFAPSTPPEKIEGKIKELLEKV